MKGCREKERQPRFLLHLLKAIDLTLGRHRLWHIKFDVNGSKFLWDICTVLEWLNVQNALLNENIHFEKVSCKYNWSVLRQHTQARQKRTSICSL